MTTDTEPQATTQLSIDADLSFAATTAQPTLGSPDLAGFNSYGVRTNLGSDGEIESVDVIYRAMQTGKRKNLRVTAEFLSKVAANFSQPIPFQYDHSPSQMANVGTINRVWYSDDHLWLMGNVPNTGSSIRTDAIADFTHDPPAITDGSVGFGRDYEIAYDDSSDEYVFVDASLVEFSLTPFPAGYDEGGLSPAFCEAANSLGILVDDVTSYSEATENKTDESAIGVSRARITEIDLSTKHEEN